MFRERSYQVVNKNVTIFCERSRKAEFQGSIKRAGFSLFIDDKNKNGGPYYSTKQLGNLNYIFFSEIKPKKHWNKQSDFRC
jgi:hypothetical protein